MSLKDKMLLYLLENPKATNEALAEEFEIKESYVKTIISKLKASNRIRVEGQGNNRKIEVLKIPKQKVDIEKRERYERQLDFLEEIMFSDLDAAHRLEASAQHIRILNKF